MRNRRRVTILGIVLLVFLVRLVFAEGKPVLNLKYENNLLTADIESATIKDIFEELKKQAGLTYEIEKEIQEQKVTISFKEKELTQAIKDILNTIGNPSYMISYKNVGAIGQSPKYAVSGITIRKRGAMETTQVAKMELQDGEIEIGLSDGKYRIRAKNTDVKELLERLSSVGKDWGKIVVDPNLLNKKIDFESEHEGIIILVDRIFYKIRPKIYNITSYRHRNPPTPRRGGVKERRG